MIPGEREEFLINNAIVYGSTTRWSMAVDTTLCANHIVRSFGGIHEADEEYYAAQFDLING